MKKLITILILLSLSLFAGKYEVMEKKATRILSGYNYYDGYERYERAMRHNLLAKEIEGGNVLMTAISGSEKAQCTACPTFVSLLVFDADGKPIEHYHKIDTLSTRGRIDFILAEVQHKYESHEYFDVVDIREFGGKPFVMLHTAFSQYTSAFEWISVYAKVNGKFRKVADLETAYSEQIRDPEYEGNELYETEWKAEISLKKKKNNLPDIILKKSGKKNHKAFQETEIYEFKKNLNKFKKK